MLLLLGSGIGLRAWGLRGRTPSRVWGAGEQLTWKTLPFSVGCAVSRGSGFLLREYTYVQLREHAKSGSKDFAPKYTPT